MFLSVEKILLANNYYAIKNYGDITKYIKMAMTAKCRLELHLIRNGTIGLSPSL